MSSRLSVQFFGPPQIRVAGELLPQFRSRKSLWLFALLALRHGNVVTRDWVASTLWPDTESSVALANLRPTLHDLRQALKEEAARLRAPDRATLMLDLQDVEFDVISFDKAIKLGGDNLREAVDLYVGPLLEGCTEEWVHQERAARENDFANALQTLGDEALRDGDWTLSTRLFNQLILTDPWRDSARRGLMQSFASSGDVNAALHVYREFAKLLSTEALTSPDSQTTALYERLRMESQRRSIRAREPRESPNATISGHVPHAVTALVGRDDEINDIAGALRRHRLVTLCGPGGIGKTRLGMAVPPTIVGEYADGVWLVSLEGIQDERLVAAHITASLGLAEVAGLTPSQLLVKGLRGKAMLLVLDNCEHVQSVVASLCATILRECGRVRILATSRHSLGIQGENVWTVAPLPSPNISTLPDQKSTRMRIAGCFESVQLFVERARAANRSFQLTPENALAVATVCSKLEGVPLAIELAAACLKAMTAEALDSRLRDQLRLLTAGDRGASGRQRTLRDTIDWSYGLLTDLEKALLHRLSVFSGGWTLEAAEAVAAFGEIAERDVAGLQRSLVEKSIVSFDTNRGRFYLLESVRQYAAEKLQASRDNETALAGHRAWCLELARSAETASPGADQQDRFTELDAETDNLRAALVKGEADSAFCLQLSAALWRYWYRRRRYHEGRQFLEQALASNANHDSTWAIAAYGAGALAYYEADYVASERHHLASLEVRRKQADLKGVAASLDALGSIAQRRGALTIAQSYSEESLSLRRKQDDPFALATGLYNYGALSNSQSNYATAVDAFAEALQVSRAAGNNHVADFCLVGLGVALLALGSYDLAQANLEEAVGAFRDSKDPYGTAWSLHLLGKAFMERGDLVSARAMAQEGLDLFESLGDREGTVQARLVVSEVTLEEGDFRTAWSLQESARQIAETIGVGPPLAEALCRLGWTARQMQDWSAARDLSRRSLAMMVELETQRGVAECLTALLIIAVDEENYTEAARLGGAAELLREEIGSPVRPFQNPPYQSAIARARDELGAIQFDQLWRQARDLGWRKVVDQELAKERESDS